MVRVTHPFYPLADREFVFIALRQTWGEDRVFFYDDEDGTVCSLPVGWTDAAPADVFVTVAAGRSPLRVEDLVVLRELVTELGATDSRRARGRIPPIV
jgi:hypothetical protein